MKTFTLLIAFGLIAAAAAYGGSSYVSRHDHNIPGHEQEHGHEEHHDYYHHPAYKFEYGVKDPHTKDHHSQWEHRDGDVVKGEYSLDEADGTKRVVKYSSDKHSGFQAHVERIGHADHPVHYGHHDEHHY
ncbi:cuticle protein 19-like [Chironomus tepperi]|uniref:cuticle protein 19-like n=1 Tax=Chironomus tepperi TaxID=113505 RepID=UPI00391FADA4